MRGLFRPRPVLSPERIAPIGPAASRHSGGNRAAVDRLGRPPPKGLPEIRRTFDEKVASFIEKGPAFHRKRRRLSSKKQSTFIHTCPALPTMPGLSVAGLVFSF